MGDPEDRSGNWGHDSGGMPPFVALTWKLLNSKCYLKLSFAAKAALPYFLGKVKMDPMDPQRYEVDFKFSYPEAERLGFAAATFSRIINDLVRYGLIDPIERGGLRGFKKGYNIFRLSKRHELWETPEFVQINWEDFLLKK